MKKFLINILALSLVVQVSASDTLSSIQTEILYSILNLQFGRADSLLGVAAEIESSDPETLYLQNYLEFLEALISGERHAFNNYLENSGERIKIIRQGEQSNAGSLICLSSIHISSAVLSAYHAENYRAARHFYNSFRYLKQSEQKEVNDERKFLNRGLITIGAGSVPEEYRWLLSLFGMKGGIEEGIGYLQEYHAFTSRARRLEACLILNSVAKTVDPGRQDHRIPLDCNNDSISLFRYVRALRDLSDGKSRAVIENLGNYKQAEGERKLLFMDLLLGEALLNSLDASASIPLRNFAENYEGMHYRHYGWHKLSWHYALSGEWDRYGKARQKVLDSGEAYLDADLQALSEARDSLPLNIDLLRARVLYDGGYYMQALDELESPDSVILRNQRDTVEYHYRLARIYDRRDMQAMAIACYEQVLESGSDEPWYFAPNAALNLGLIYEEKGDNDKALELYHECLKINKSAYKKSIDYKARQGIRRMEELKKLQ